MKIQYRLQTKLILSYTLLAVFIVALISVYLNFSINKSFEKYVIEKHNENVETLMHNLIYSYEVSNGFNLNDITHLGVEAIEQGFIITVLDNNHQIIWSASEHNSGLCETMINNVKDNMFNHYSSWRGDYTEETYPLITNNKIVAELTVGYLGPYYFNEEELFFLTTVNKILTTVVFLAFLLSIFIGIFIAHSITSPIEKVMNHLNFIHSHKKKDTLTIQTGSIEIQSLYKSAQLLENRIHEQEDLRRRLTQDMAHELKTPLTAIQGTLEAMMDGIFPLSIERLNSCHEEIIRIKNLINEVESLSIIENNNLTLNYEETNITGLIEKILFNHDKRLAQNEQLLQIQEIDSINKELLYGFPCDPSKIKQVLINLIDNSIKYAGKGTVINIQLEILLNKDLRIKYSDNGLGVPATDIPFIFERFYRIDTSRTGNKGLGIGLTLSKSLIENHQGSIEIDREFEKGLSFNIELPYKNIHEKII